jgi:hypothetical protein
MSDKKYSVSVLDSVDVKCYKQFNTKAELKAYLKTLGDFELSQVTELSFKKHALCKVKVSEIVSVAQYLGSKVIEYKVWLGLLKTLRGEQ